MFADLVASAPGHDATARPTLLAGIVHLALVAMAIQFTRSAIEPPPHPTSPPSEVYLTPHSTVSATTAAEGGTTGGEVVPAAAPDFASTPVPEFAVDVPAVALGDRSRRPVTDPGGAPVLGALLPSGSPDSIWRAAEVDEPVGEQRGPAPVYPPILARMGLTGSATLQYVVGADGRVEPNSVVVIGATRTPFGDAAAAAIREARFSPAKKRGVAVRQLVQQQIRFTLEGTR